MALTRTKRLLLKLLGLSLLSLMALPIQGHPGHTDSGGCHAGKLPRHCHAGARSGHPAQGNPSAPMKDTGHSALRTAASEDDYNRWFCTRVNGETATRHGYTSAGGRRYVEVDCETGKRPAVVIYDTDGAGRDGLSTASGLPAGKPGCVMRFFGRGLVVGVIYDVEFHYMCACETGR